MKIEIIENIESELPLYIITGKNTLNIPNTERRKTSKRIIDTKTNKKTALIITQDNFQEGGMGEIFAEIKRQKRNPKLREEAIRQYGYNCFVCNFNFEGVYGEFGVGYIEVHHLALLSAIKNERTLTTKDVAVVCANCHRVLHRNGKKPMPLLDLKRIVEEKRNLKN